MADEGKSNKTSEAPEPAEARTPVLPTKRLPQRPLTPDELKLYYISPEELPAFQADPLREEKLGWTSIIVCRLCGRKLEKLPQHLMAEHWEALATPETATAETLTLTEEYRRRFGHNKNAPLCCQRLRDVHSRNLKAIIARLKHQGRPVRRRGFRKGRTPTQAALQARKIWGISRQQQQRMSASRSHRPHRKKNDAVPDWQIAKLRLEGKEYPEIAKKLSPPLTESGARGRSHRIGLPPGKRCLFFRGESVTEKLLLAHFEDLKYLRMSRPLTFRTETQGDGQHAPLSVAEAAEFLGVPKWWIYDRTRQRSKDEIPHSRSAQGVLEFDPRELLQWALRRRSGKSSFLTTRGVEEDLARRLGRSRFRVYEFLVRPGGPRSPRKGKPRKPNHPLSWDMATRLLSSIASLRDEFRRVGSTAKGGRGKALLPSEEKELPGKYHALKADLHLMLSWAERQDEKITMDRLGEWMCDKWRAGQLRVLLLWPSLHSRLPEVCERVRNRLRGRLAAAERAKEFLHEDYGISPAALDRVILKPAA
jgi:hypothetical protein